MSTALGTLLVVGSAGLLIAALAAVAIRDLQRARLTSAAVGAVAATVLAVAGGFAVFGTTAGWELFSGFGLGSGGFSADRLTGLFLLVSALAAAPLLAATTARESAGGTRVAATLRPLLVLLVAGVYLADNVFLFLVVWEVSVLTMFALVATRYRDPDASRAADLLITLAKLGGGAITAAFILLAAQAGTFSFSELASRGPQLDSTIRGICFVLFFLGFGVKAAVVPLQTWLPRAYSETSAENSGLLAAVALNLAFYGMIRTWFGFLGEPEVWWAVVVLLAGGVTALLGILGGILQTRLRAFIAYSSIENAGIIITGLGIALMGAAEHEPGLLGLGLVAATFQMTAHAIAKAELFTAAASVEHATRTDDMERLGGLYRALPLATFGALFGAAALAALPPFSGFVSEWMTFEGLMQGFRVPGTGAHLAMALAGALLALTAGLAALAFVRAIGMTFGGMPRDRDVARRSDSRTRGAVLVVLGLGSLAIGIAGPWIVEVLENGLAGVGGEAAFGRVAQRGWLVQPGYPDFASISPTVLAITLTAFGLGFWTIRALLRARARARVVPVWASATPVNGTRAQYSAFGYANMTRVIFNVVYRIRPRVRTHGDERFPERISLSRDEPRLFDPEWLYRPITRAFTWAGERIRVIQAGYLGLYLFYLMIVLVVLLIVAPRV
jgi:hydrogenase-4 component B